jgi:hypothetical protein
MNSFTTRHSSVAPRGFAALLSAILLSAILTALVFGASTSAIWARYDQLDRENKLQSSALADSCAYDALLQFVQNPASISQAETISISSGTCSIDQITYANNLLTISTHAKSNESSAVSMLTANVDPVSDTLSIISWRQK